MKNNKIDNSKFFVGADLCPLYYKLKKMRKSSFTRAIMCKDLAKRIKDAKNELYSNDPIDHVIYRIVISYYMEVVNDGTIEHMSFKERRKLTDTVHALSTDIYGDKEAWREHIPQ